MAENLRYVPPSSIITGWDFSTGAVKCLAFDLEGNALAELRYPTDLWTEGDVSELSIMQLEGQVRATTRAMANKLKDLGRLHDWIAGGVSATHHSAGRIDRSFTQVRRIICWNDYTLVKYHALGLERLGGPERVKHLIGAPWAVRYTLSHLVKDEEFLSAEDWRRTTRIAQHGVLAGGFLTGSFDVVSVSSAASTGIMDFRSRLWQPAMLQALATLEHRELAWKQLPRIVEQDQPLGEIHPGLALESGIPMQRRPLIFPTSDDQQAGLVGGGAVSAGQMAIILGYSAVVNSSSSKLPASGELDAMCLNWGPYLWMRCYNNGAQFLDRVVGPKPDWEALEREASNVPAGCGGVTVSPFSVPEPALGILDPGLQWHPAEPKEPGVRFRASLEALAYLIARAVHEHEAAGQTITRITVSGGIARSKLMCAILASVLDKPLDRLQSDEGSALGAAVTALAAYENYNRRLDHVDAHFTVADAVGILVKFRDQARPNPAWREAYARGYEEFLTGLEKRRKKLA